MKTILVTIALSFTTYFLTAQTEAETDSEGTTITITVPLHSNEGMVRVGLYDASNFMQKPLVGADSEIIDLKATVSFKNVIPGEYAVILYHDKNNNNQMDFDPNGMPLEMYGMSNNPMSYGPPQWIDAKFEVATNPVELEIRL
jgi:uncharacterized protein (DUF2141 family)